ncbi:MAG: alkaline phosphatase [Ilumatobacteraceae bacterium]|nr:alkaline phosphatase [Ilumatobacteraceae bacterium]
MDSTRDVTGESPSPIPTDGPYRHGVASGDPTLDAVIIWTRLSEIEHTIAAVEWVMARDRALTDIVRSGAVTTSAEHDWTVHVDVTGLEPGSTYFYAFDTDGCRSPVGRTRTLPRVDASELRFAFVSCAKFNAGFFNVYGRIAERDDLDFVLHLGDYIYEASNTPPKNQTPGADIGRPFAPLGECRTLDDYRTRYAQYHLDPDVHALHAAHPMIASLDDHEFADGAWREGSDNHDPERDGPWAVRRAAAFQVRWEWLPARKPDPNQPERAFRSVELGGLAELFLMDYRSRRDRPVFGAEMSDPTRTALGAEQRAWLVDRIAHSPAHWRLIGNPSPFAQTWQPGLSDDLHRSMRALKFMHATEDTVDEDQWDGYPAERDAILTAIDAAGPGRSIVLAGDLHVSLALELTHPSDRTRPLAVEVVTPSITSQNLDEKLHLTPRTAALQIERDFVNVIPGLEWCELESHGYVVAAVTAEQIVLQWWFVDTVLERTGVETLGNEMVVLHGDPHIRPAR